jgi:hypothetical protein
VIIALMIALSLAALTFGFAAATFVLLVRRVNEALARLENQ